MLHITGNAPPHFSITVPPPTGFRVHAVDLARVVCSLRPGLESIAETGSIYPLAPSVSDPDSNEYLFESSASIAEGAALGFHLQKFAVGLPPGSYSPEDRFKFHGFPSASPLLAFFSCRDSGHAAGSSNVEMVDVPGPRVVPDERKARATILPNPAVILFIFPPAIAETGSVHPFVPSASDPDSNEWLFELSASIAEGAALGVVCWSSLYSPERFMAFTNLESKPRKPQWCPTRARNQRMSFSIATASSASVGRSCTANPAEIRSPSPVVDPHALRPRRATARPSPPPQIASFVSPRQSCSVHDLSAIRDPEMGEYRSPDVEVLCSV
ncbi:hypothetical protein B0H16DRAFT_1734129 [Mycena metata]|uniref:Uncharacterized protein n=1 Tax=Mycena metata TaxID=1033252 RepID=A0AAD7MS30_9AGAR|nr:hypothetical protein B0H16DRAFT_1734129 [Mycena metata]